MKQVTSYTTDTDIARALNERIEIPEPGHSIQVACLALLLFDLSADELVLTPESRPWLAAGALWHDLGYYRGAQHHHRDSANIVMDEKLSGYTGAERSAIAQIARYHRGPEPDTTHRSFASLKREHRVDIEKCAAILRLAEALDASHLSAVTHLDLQFAATNVQLLISGDTFLNEEVEKTASRSALFERVSHRDLHVRQSW